MIKQLIFILVIFSGTLVSAQNLSLRTNEMSLNAASGGVLPDTGPLPVIKWITPALDYASSEQNKIDIQATISLSASAKHIRLVVTNNETKETLVAKRIETNDETLLYDIKLPMTIPDGSMTITIEVTTKQEITISEKRNLLIGQGALDNVLSLNRKDYALFFATDKYDHWTDLVNPIDDAHALAKDLKDIYGFQVEIVENPTLEEMWKKLREYNERKFSPQDQLLVFFAGHGQYDETFGEGYVVAKNSQLSDPSRNTYLSHNRLRGVINNIPCNHILLTMDVCFGGTLDPAIARHRGNGEHEASISEMVARKLSHRTRKYLTSGGKEYVSDGIPGKHSPFSEKLIESLRSFGGEDRVLTLAEIQVTLEKMKQLPRMGSFGEDEMLSDFVFVAKNR